MILKKAIGRSVTALLSGALRFTTFYRSRFPKNRLPETGSQERSKWDGVNTEVEQRIDGARQAPDADKAVVKKAHACKALGFT
jgi:hypothetical protein